MSHVARCSRPTGRSRRAGLSATPLVEVVDEVLFEVAEDELHQTAAVCAHAMRHAFELEVPLVVGVEAGKTWADLAPLKLPEDAEPTRSE